MKIRLLTCVFFSLIAVGILAADLKPERTKIKWANVPRFDCKPSQGLLTSWTGQPGMADHQDSSTFKAKAYMACRAMSAPNTQPPAACFISFQNDGQYTIPSHQAVQGPDKGDVLTLSCNGTAPTCCQVQMWDSRAAAEKADKTDKTQ